MHDRGRTAPVTHYDVHGLVMLRLYDAPQHIVDDVTRELGAPRAVAEREPDPVVRRAARPRPCCRSRPRVRTTSPTSGPSSAAPGPPLTTAYQQFRFTFPDRVSAALDTVRERELALLVDAPDDLPAYEIRHPCPVRPHELYDAADPYC